ncbi:MAG: phosphate signaling complex PhoU family protein [Akkermansia sp.]
MTPPGNHILPHYDAALNAIRTRVNAVCGSLLKHMDVLERVISGPDSDGANGIIADGEPLSEETRQVLSLCAAVLTQFHPLGSDLRLVITFSGAGQAQGCMEEVTGIAKHAKASIRHRDPSPRILCSSAGNGRIRSRDAARCLETQDVDAARNTPARQKLDKAHRSAGPSGLPRTGGAPALNVNLLFIIRSLERIGDIAKTIAATVVFLKEATDIRHGKEK